MTQKKPAILTINTGSSSVKFALYEVGDGGLGALILRGSVSGLPDHFHVTLSEGHSRLRLALEEVLTTIDNPETLVAAVDDALMGPLRDYQIVAVGHRVVHGGRRGTGPARVSADLLDELESLASLAPQHQHRNLIGVRAIAARWPDLIQTLSFDTAFHRDQAMASRLFALPRRLTEDGVVRFGFHGLSYAHLAERLPEVLRGRRHSRTVAAHLGSGASLCALRDGRSVATTMGMTALGGLPMRTRSGDLDPGVVLHLLQDRGMSVSHVSELLYEQSGLSGMTGTSGDVRVLLDSETAEARDALDYFCHRVAQGISSLAVSLDGLDAVVFTGGIGENSAWVRDQVCRNLRWMGITLEPDANAGAETLISAPDSEVAVAIVPSDEERIIAREALEVLAAEIAAART